MWKGACRQKDSLGDFLFYYSFFILFLILFCLKMVWTKPWGFIMRDAVYTALACIRWWWWQF